MLNGSGLAATAAGGEARSDKKLKEADGAATAGSGSGMTGSGAGAGMISGSGSGFILTETDFAGGA